MADRKPQLFEQTSQYQHWRFTPSSLAKLRAENNRLGVDRVLLGLQQEAQVDDQGASDTRIAEATDNLLTPAEELKLIGFYLQMIKFCAKVYMTSKLLKPESLNNVKATAINFMKRFYLHNVVFDYHPKNIMLTCLYLATKVENAFMKIDDFIRPLAAADAKSGSKTVTKSEDVLGLEFIVIQSLQFELAVHHPYRAAYGFYLDMQQYIEDKDRLRDVYERTAHYIDQSLHTDLVFFYQPSQIALGAFKLAAKDKDFDVDLYLTQRFDARSLELLFLALDEIQDGITGFAQATKEDARLIDRKLILCRNPEKNPNSVLYKKTVVAQGDVPYVSDSDSD
ncbi:hypothetical protein GGI04_001457 [Coemansia thaxteri]|uniref:Cyclin-like domain-containing protein n=1 Tax=Coemansia thaxteri TaxID=2663907 RepID=A0A9W8BK51_9FUNG|nr:hypothetical protein H4R26_002880 [Coemansia thaxteri]KAJ2007624.1 hypothetical protein GGI04_001457 [Coemansia thaxteri]KAJ2472699.1 hypothetical protein GGI02_001392 [Coemansia sp. RSA 2322]